jgi:hypothetical protein
MLISDLLKSDVFDESGELVGNVQDVRMIQDGPVQGAFGPAFRVQGLVVGRRSIGERLGFDRDLVRGPWPLKKMFARLHHAAKFVEWSLVRSIEGERITIAGARDALPEP